MTEDNGSDFKNFVRLCRNIVDIENAQQNELSPEYYKHTFQSKVFISTILDRKSIVRRRQTLIMY